MKKTMTMTKTREFKFWTLAELLAMGGIIRFVFFNTEDCLDFFIEKDGRRWFESACPFYYLI